MFDIFINTHTKFEKKVALAALKSLHASHANFSKTLLKNMHSYLHNTANSDDNFKRIVEILPLPTSRMSMELLELYMTILSRLLTEVVTHTQKKTNSIKRRRRFAILGIVLMSLMESASNYPILRE